MNALIRTALLAAALGSHTTPTFGAMIGFETMVFPPGFADTLDIAADDDPSFISHWFRLGGTPTGTQFVKNSGDDALYNNGNDDIGVRFDTAIDFNSAYLIGWASFPSHVLTITGYNSGLAVASLTVSPVPRSWTQYLFDSSFDSVDEVRFHTVYTHPSLGTLNFGTFAIDDINVIPTSTGGNPVPDTAPTLSLLLAAATALVSSRRKRA